MQPIYLNFLNWYFLLLKGGGIENQFTKTKQMVYDKLIYTQYIDAVKNGVVSKYQARLIELRMYISFYNAKGRTNNNNDKGQSGET